MDTRMENFNVFEQAREDAINNLVKTMFGIVTKFFSQNKNDVPESVKKEVLTRFANSILDEVRTRQDCKIFVNLENKYNN